MHSTVKRKKKGRIMSHNVSLPFCIHGRICRMFYHLLLIMLLCLLCTSADCFKAPVCNGFSFSVYVGSCIVMHQGCPSPTAAPWASANATGLGEGIKALGAVSPETQPCFSRVECYQYSYLLLGSTILSSDSQILMKAKSSQCEMWFLV